MPLGKCIEVAIISLEQRMTSRDSLFTLGKRNSAEKKRDKHTAENYFQNCQERMKLKFSEILKSFKVRNRNKGRAIHQYHVGVKRCRKESLKSIF